MKNIKCDKKAIKYKMEELRLSLNSAYVKHGNTKEVVRMSQELDKYISIAQGK